MSSMVDIRPFRWAGSNGATGGERALVRCRPRSPLTHKRQFPHRLAGYGHGQSYQGGSNSRPLPARHASSKTKTSEQRLRATGATHGGIPFERGSLFYLLRNRCYIAEVKYKGEIL